MTTPRRLAIPQILVSLALLVGACSSPVPATTGDPSPVATGAPGTMAVSPIGTPAVMLVQFAEASDAGAAAQQEMQLVRQAREDAGMAALIGQTGADPFAALDRIEQEFAAQLISEVAAAIDAGTIPQGAAPVSRGIASLALFQIDASLFADTGFTASAIMTLYSQVIQQAAQSQSGTLSRQETIDRVEGTLRHQVDLSTTFTIQTGGGRVSADLIMSATDRMSDPQTGSFVALYTSRTVGHFDVSACPDEAGVAEGTYTFETKHELNDVSSPQAANSAAGRSVEAPFRLIDGEDAHLVHIEAALDMEADAHGPGSPSGPGPTSAFDWGATQQAQIVMPVRGSTTGTGSGIAVTGTGGQQAGGAMFISSAMAQLFLMQVGKEAERFWRSGECIVINTTKESRDVSPGEEVEFEAEAEGRFDHEEVEAPIKGEFSGKDSLDPSGEPQDPPAQFTFTAGSEKDDKGTIKLEQVGVRGIGRKTVEFTVAPSDYRFDISLAGFGGMRGQKCDGHEGAWTINASGAATPGTITFTIPEGATTAQAHAVWDLASSGPATVHWDIKGPVTFIDGDPAMLSFGTLVGTATVRVPGVPTQTVPTEQIPFEIPLEKGDFCE